MSTEDKREKRLQLLEDDIGRALAQSHANGELRSAKNFGKPLDLGDGYGDTPPELRMGMKILKDAGVLPPEVELMQEIEKLRQSLEGAADTQDTVNARRRLTAMQQQLALRMEQLRGDRRVSSA